MKPIFRIFTLLIGATSLVHSQDNASAVSDDSTAAPVPVSTAARILGNIPDGTPPPPAEPKPGFVVPKKDILDTTIQKEGGRTITIREIKPIALPPPPAPVEPSTTGMDEDFRKQLAEYQEEHPKSDLLFIGATVFRAKDSPPRTLVRFWPGGKSQEITFWSSADFALIAGGISSFTDNAGDTHSILMGWGNVDIERMTDLYAAKGRVYDAPAMPDFPDEKAAFKIVGQQPSPEEIAPIEALHELYNKEYAELLRACQGREKARLENEAELKAHPPKPKDITLNYWRTEKPASQEQGGAIR
ncbi:hypothetical protein [Luteolibacter sp.]|uniref:hypothetical protein n=1 Tax=Luteolibacter sp. TaxID=1962973 RepID=UPI003267BBC4